MRWKARGSGDRYSSGSKGKLFGARPWFSSSYRSCSCGAMNAQSSRARCKVPVIREAITACFRSRETTTSWPSRESSLRVASFMTLHLSVLKGVFCRRRSRHGDVASSSHGANPGDPRRSPDRTRRPPGSPGMRRPDRRKAPPRPSALQRVPLDHSATTPGVRAVRVPWHFPKDLPSPPPAFSSGWSSLSCRHCCCSCGAGRPACWARPAASCPV